MRSRQPALVITFSTTTAAIGAEKLCMEQHLPGRLIPVPREITAGCGLAWKAPVEERERFVRALEAGGIQWSAMQVVEI